MGGYAGTGLNPVLAKGMSSSISSIFGRSTSSSSSISSAGWGEELPVDPAPSSTAACVCVWVS